MQLLLGTRKGLLLMEQVSGRWCVAREWFDSVPVSYAMLDPRTDTLWAALDHGHWGQKLHRSKDRGATWEEIAAPAFPADAEYKPGVPAVVSYLWYIAPGGADQPNRLYIGTEPGGLFVSDDGGDTWTLNQALWDHPSRADWWFGGGRDHPGVCSIVVDPRNSQHVTVGVSVGGVFETRDGGQTWEGRNAGLYAYYLPDPHSEYGHDPHFMVASPDNPDVLWQQNHCGIFRSVDGGKQWANISQPPAFFGFAIAVENAQTAWVIPARSDEFRVAVDRSVCVCRTQDGGQTWTPLRTGLPQTDSYDLVFRHALDLRGERLAFGSTTGNAFLSEDRGESWTEISHHLPPIYSVRFVD